MALRFLTPCARLHTSKDELAGNGIFRLADYEEPNEYLAQRDFLGFRTRLPLSLGRTEMTYQYRQIKQELLARKKKMK